MEKFEILLTITTEKRLTIIAPNAEMACNIAEAVALSTDVFDEAEDMCRDAVAEILKEEEESGCDGCPLSHPDFSKKAIPICLPKS